MKLMPLSLRSSVLAAAVAAALLAACGGGGYDEPAAVPAETIASVLTADQEVAPADSGAFGSATLTLDRGTRTLSATITTDGVTATAAHIHAGAAGSNGAVVFPLTLTATGATLAATVLSQAQLDSLDAGELYLNVHSAANAGGELRGQIGREVFGARLTGTQESTPVATAATGTGRLVLNPITRALSGGIELQGMTATAAHIHAGAFGSNGAVVIALEDHGGNGHYEVPANTVLTAAQVDALRAGEFYFNAHSATHAGGEIRGQIGRRVLLASASGAEEVPSNGSAATGGAFVTYDPTNRKIQGAITLSGMTATAAHIHMAAAGVNGPVVVALAETAAGSGVWAVPADTQLSAEQAAALLSGGMYFNAHSAAFAPGEIRGQLIAQ